MAVSYTHLDVYKRQSFCWRKTGRSTFPTKQIPCDSLRLAVASPCSCLLYTSCPPWAEDDPSCADYQRAFLNPEIYEYSVEKTTYNEGCLSFPGCLL